MQKIGAVMFFLVFCCQSYAQEMSTKYYAENPAEEIQHQVETDTLLFYISFGVQESLFDRQSRYGLGSTTYTYRGDVGTDYTINGISCSQPFNPYPDYTLLSHLRRTPTRQTYYSTKQTNPYSLGEKAENYSTRAIDNPLGHSVRLQYADRNYQSALSTQSVGMMGEKSSYAVSISGRWGRDRFIGGVFSDEATLSFAFDHLFSANNRLSLFLLAAPSLRSTRSWTTQEVFDLTGDNLYNPSWGLYGDEVRSSKVRRDFTPFFMATYDFRIGKDTQLSASLMIRAGERSRSGLTWYDARSPLPDYYFNLPSWLSDPGLNKEATSMWREGDKKYTQLNWDELFKQNKLARGESVYIADLRVEQTMSIRAHIDGTTIINSKLQLNYSADYSIDRSRFFKRAEDMLGSEWALDVDQYLIDDEVYGDKYLNDVRNPNREVREGDDFGYNYAMLHNKFSVHATILYSHLRYKGSIGVGYSSVSLQRKGNYEKATFVDAGAFGLSPKVYFGEKSIKTTGHYMLSARSNLGFSAYYTEHSPDYNDIFISPQAYNRIADNIATTKRFGVEGSYDMVLGGTVFNLSAYFNRQFDKTDITRYYDDLFGVFCDMVASGINTNNYGAELSADIRLSSRWGLSVSGALNSYRYTSSVKTDIYADVDGKEMLVGGESKMKGLISSSSPQNLLITQISYKIPYSWYFNLECSVAGSRYVSPSILYRTDRVLNSTNSPESTAMFTQQERLPIATSLNLFVHRRFSLWGGYLVLSFSIKNLLNQTDIIYGGYESWRVRRTGTKPDISYAPFDTKYSYAYPRNYYLSITYEF